jgi:hypothetical protein
MEMDILMKITIESTILDGRPQVFLQWLTFLREIHEGFDSETERLPTFEELKKLLLAAKQAVCNDAFQSCDEAALFKEKITGDDVAGVRQSAIEVRKYDFVISPDTTDLHHFFIPWRPTISMIQRPCD